MWTFIQNQLGKNHLFFGEPNSKLITVIYFESIRLGFYVHHEIF